MRLYSEIDLPEADEADIQDRDIAIVELYSELQRYVELAALRGAGCEMEKTRQNLILKKYEDFAKATSSVYGYVISKGQIL